MRLVFVLLVCASSVVAQRRERPSVSRNPVGMSEAVIAEGGRLYNQACTVCHGVDGEVGDRAPALKGTRRFLRRTETELFDAIRNGIQGTLMPATKLSDDETWKIVAWIRSMRATAADAPAPGVSTRGERIFWERAKCGDCHMINGRGGILGPELSNIARERTLIQIREALTKTRPDIPRGYQPARVVTAAGKNLSGVIRNENNFSIQLLDRQGQLHSLPRDQIRELQYDKTSLMPRDWNHRLATDEYRDLVAFLSRQTRSTGTAVAAKIATTGAKTGVSDDDLLKADPRNWLTYHGAYNGQRHSKLAQIHKGNVGQLAPRWMYAIRDANRLESVPVVVDGIMYVSQPNEIYAIDGRTGRIIWDYHREPAIQRGPNRGVAVYGNKVYFGTPDAKLVALDARTGAVVWEAELARAEDGYWSPVAPLVVRGKVIIGIAPGDHGLNGFLDAYDPETGRRLWRWEAIPRPGEPGSETWSGDSWKTAGGDTWLTGSYDPELNLIYWGIGNPAPDFNGDMREGDNLYTECMVALDADTGKMKWYFQYTPHDVHDWDAVEIPVLVDAMFKGKQRKLLAQANRNGFYYVLDRVTGEFLHGTPFVKLLNWATGLTPKGRPIRVPGVEPTLQGNKVCPATAGATNWMSPAYNPSTGLFYVVAQEGCGISYKSTDTFRPGGFPFAATGYVESPDEQWQMHVRALDLTTGQLKWDYKQIGSKRYGAGLLSTAGGLIFAGDDQGFLTALDAASGKALWHFNTGRQISASPMTYEIDGKQYVALTAGSNVVAFALP